MDCIFCKIINGDIPSYTVFEDEAVKVILDINPNANGHLLVISKKHIKDLDDITIDELSTIHIIAKKMKKFLEEKLNCNGITLVQNNGIAQDIKHYHLHIIPKYSNKQNLKSVEEIFNLLKN